MNERHKTKVYLIISLVLIPLLANFIAVMSGFVIYQIIQIPRFEKALVEMEKLSPINIGSTFFIIIIIMIIYIRPIFDLVSNKSKNITKLTKSKKRLLFAPIVLGFLGFCGWLLSYFLFWVAKFILQTPLPLEYIFISFWSSVLNGTVCMVLTYYINEILNRNYFIPKLIGNDKLSKYTGFVNVSIKIKFLLYYVAIALFPIFLLFSTIVTMNVSISSPGYIHQDNTLSVFIVVMILIALGLFLTLMVSKSYQSPLLEMRNATSKIQTGDYNIEIQVRSTDEVGILGEAINDMAKGLKEKEIMKDTFGKIVDPAVRDYLLDGNVKLGGELKEVTVLFCDIRGFTSLSEKLAPTEIVMILNRYFEKMSNCITEEKGLVNKYIGDAVMAIFGTPIKIENHAKSAVNAALKMRRAKDKLNIELQKESLPLIQNGIGIHSGIVLAGNIGSTSRMEYTVIGDTVNLSSRIEGLCKEFKKDIIISESTLSKLDDNYVYTFLDEVHVKGKSKPVKIYGM